MCRFKMVFSYDGTNFLGSQRQTEGRTVEGEINKALSIIHKKDLIIYTSGRTDRGVHALNQVAHFDSSLDIKVEKLKNAINSLLPLDIMIKDIKKVNKDFHARHQAVKKEYIYIISKEYDLFNRNYETFINKDLNVNIIKEAIKLFIGKHDFFGFSSYVKDKPTVKEIFAANVIEKESKIIITFTGDNFLRYMVRRMIGTLIDIGIGKKDKNIINEIFLTKDKTLCGKTIEPNGLYLNKVFYQGEE